MQWGGRYRIIDFMLSNMVNSGIYRVGVLMKDKYQSLIDHIGNAKDWDLSRKNSGVTPAAAVLLLQEGICACDRRIPRQDRRTGRCG